MLPAIFGPKGIRTHSHSPLAARVKFYGDALKFSTVRMTDEPDDLPHFFTSLENVFDV